MREDPVRTAEPPIPTQSRPSSKVEVVLGRVGRSVLPFCLGAVVFFLVSGGSILRPTNDQWMMKGDPIASLLGWMFYRNAPLLQQPFGATPDYGLQISNSTVYSDSVSVLAFLFKPFAHFLPEHFQYFGLWLLICFMLQAFFAWKLMGVFAPTLWHRAVATAFFLIAPPFLWRTQWHMGLAAHWVVLASIYLYTRPSFKILLWLILLIVACLATPILLAMGMLMLGATLVKAYFRDEVSLTRGVLTVVVTAICLSFVMWQAGYFLISTVGEGGFGFYRASLYGLIDPGVGAPGDPSVWSSVLPDLPKAPGNYEGFGFLGAGMLILVLTAGLLGLHQASGWLGWLRWRDWRRRWALVMPLLVVFVFSFVFALSNNIGYGNHISIHYDLPGFLDRLTSPLRASGRFIWLAYYMIMAAALIIVFTHLGRRISLFLLSWCLLFQVVDSWGALTAVQARFAANFPRPTLWSPFWQQAAARYRKILYVLPDNSPPSFFPLCYFAAEHHLGINIGSWARVDKTRLASSRRDLIDVLKTGQWDPNALYVFGSDQLRNVGLLRMQKGDWIGVEDKMNVLAPGWGEAPLQDPEVLRSQLIPSYSLGTRLAFGPDDQGSRYLGYGWSNQEAWGHWSDGYRASLIFSLRPAARSDLVLEIDGIGFVGRRNPEQKIEVYANDRRVGAIAFSASDPKGLRQVRIPQEILANRDFLEIEFRFKNDISPSETGQFWKPDSRKLALGLRTLILQPASG